MSESSSAESYGLVASVTSQWPRLLFVGVLEVIVGIVSLVWPDVTALVLGLLFGVVLLLSGIVVLTISWGVRSVLGVILGALAIVAAFICFFHPGAGVVAILIGCAIWFFMLGVAYLFAAFNASEDRLWWGFLGVLSVIAAIIMIASPGVAITTVAILVGIAFILRGVSEIVFAWRLRAEHRRVIEA